MSNETVNPNQPTTPVEATPVAPPAGLDQVNAQQARELVDRAKAEGKTVEQVFLESQGQKSNPSAPKKEESLGDLAKEAARKFKVKVDGAELEVDEQELLRGYSHQRAANKLLQEGKAAKRQAEEFLALMKDPEQVYEVVKRLGHDPRTIAEKYLAAQLEEEMLDPKDRELKEARKKLKAIEDMERAHKEQIEQRRVEEMKQKYVKDYESQFIDALKSTELPATKPMIAEMAKYISRSAKIGFKMSPSEAAQLVKEDVQKAQMSLIGNADGETLLKLLGDDVAKKILTARGSKVKQTNYNTPIEQGERREIVKGSRHDGKMTAREWREFNRKK